jgi:hypothetical protein
LDNPNDSKSFNVKEITANILSQLVVIFCSIKHDPKKSFLVHSYLEPSGERTFLTQKRDVFISPNKFPGDKHLSILLKPNLPQMEQKSIPLLPFSFMRVPTALKQPIKD